MQRSSSQRPAALCRSVVRSGTRAAVVLVGLALLAGCAENPGAVLIPIPERQPDPAAYANIPATTPDGYPNVVATPVVVSSTPLEPSQQAATEQSLDATLAGQRRRPAGVTASVAEMQAAGAAHVRDARAVIDAPLPSETGASDAAAPADTVPVVQ